MQRMSPPLGKLAFIADAARRCRQRHMDEANRSCDADNLPPPSVHDLALQTRIVAGELTVMQAIELLHVRYMQADHPDGTAGCMPLRATRPADSQHTE